MPAGGDDLWVEVLAAPDIEDETPVEVVVDGTVIFLVRHGGELLAFQGLCPHQFARLGLGRVEAGFIQCPRHMARFALADGTCGPGWELPPLKRYAVRVEEGAVYISRTPDTRA